ncbi:MAG: hypothetical protein QMD77_02240 [Patescibacteria group bacterium]|nr:hypothetical protein [Patescibacteria group bacterium]
MPTDDMPLAVKIASRKFRDAFYQALGELPEGFFIWVKPLDEHLSRSNPPEDLFYQVSLHYNGPGYWQLREWDGAPANRKNGQACLYAPGTKLCHIRLDAFVAMVEVMNKKIRQAAETLSAS